MLKLSISEQMLMSTLEEKRKVFIQSPEYPFVMQLIEKDLVQTDGLKYKDRQNGYYIFARKKK